MDPISSITNGFDPRIMGALPWVGLVSKMGVDYARTHLELPTWASPALSLLVSTVLLVLAMLAEGVVPTPTLFAQVVLAAIASTGLAVGATTLQSRTRPSRKPKPALVKLVADELEQRMKTERAPAPPPKAA